MTDTSVSQHRPRRSILLGADQVVSSVSNFVTALAVASITSPAEFGAYALGGSLFALALAAARTTSSERLVMESDRGRAAFTTNSMLLVATLSAGAAVVLWWSIGDAVVLAWAAAAFPILAQDRLRFVALSWHPSAAITGDGLWLAVLAVTWFWVWYGDLPAGRGSALITSVPPLVSFLVLAVLVRNDIAVRVERDVRRFGAEFHFVLDPWLQAGAVFMAFGLAAAFGSLETVGRARALVLLFQPFVSISYVGRLIVLRSRDDAQIRRWPALSAGACAVYSGLIGVAAVFASETFLEPGDLWSFGPLAFVLMAIAQCARAFHQSVADLLRRSSPDRLVRARLAFAILLVAAVGPLVAWRDLVGLTAAWSGAYVVGAFVIRPRTSNPRLIDRA